MTRESGFPNWKDHLFKLEEVADSPSQGPERAAAHLRIARLWEEKYLQKAKAIAHYQQAFKADPGSLEALRAARRAAHVAPPGTRRVTQAGSSGISMAPHSTRGPGAFAATPVGPSSSHASRASAVANATAT